MDKPYPPAIHPHAGAAELTQHAAMPALGDAVRALITDAALAEAFTATTGASLTGVVVDWPRHVMRDDLARWLRHGDVLVELAHTPARAPLELGIALRADSAIRWIERILGGSASSAVPSAIGAPSEAECGVLAYAVARLCAVHASDFVVRDVRIAPPPPALPDALVLWPISLRTSFASLEALMLLAPSLAASTHARHTIELVVRDVLASDAPLARGDVFTSDRWTLTDTTTGLTGPLRVATSGISTELSARLERGTITVTGPASASPADEVTLVLATRDLSLAEIAALTAGAPCAFPNVGAQPALLRRDGHSVAEGELVVHRGALGVRITAT
ncbi:MAG: FliM/FliN family flagellar motor C-terminal domain-containing protein [Polyangiales bacterium]